MSVEESNNLSSEVAFLSLVVVHDSLRGREYDVAEQTGWEEGVCPLLHVGDLNVETWGDDSAFVQPSDEVDYNLVAAVVVNDREVADVLGGLHLLQELNNDWVHRADNGLTFPCNLCR